MALFVAVAPVQAAPMQAAPVQAAPVPAPTFDKDVAPIFFAHCVGCHRANEIAGNLPLQSYDGAKPLAAAIRQQVAARAMPPWPADPQHSLKFRNDARLEQRDVDTVVAWVDAGAPRGNDADLPPSPSATQGWLHPRGLKPDAVLQLPEVSLSATGELPYLEQRVKVPLTEDKWIAAMQVRPGNNAVVHHMGITEVTVKDGVTPEDLDAFAKMSRQSGIPTTVLADMHPAVADPTNPDAYDMLGVYTPGTTFEMFGNGSGKLLKAGKNAYINFNIHFTTIGTPQTSRSELALWFEPDKPQHQLFRSPAAVSTLIANGKQLLTDDAGTKAEGTDFAIPPIPRFAPNYELVGVTAYTRAVTLYQLQPHAHMRGKDFKYIAVYPDRRQITVLSVPAYDFHWQLAYQLDTPLALPAGSKLIVIAHYDNSAKNKHLTEHGRRSTQLRARQGSLFSPSKPELARDVQPADSGIRWTAPQAARCRWYRRLVVWYKVRRTVGCSRMRARRPSPARNRRRQRRCMLLRQARSASNASSYWEPSRSHRRAQANSESPSKGCSSKPRAMIV